MKNLIRNGIKFFGVLALTSFLALPVYANGNYVSKKQASQNQSKIDSEEETGYTHLEGILSNIRETGTVENLSFDEALRKTLDGMEKFQYLKDDGVEHLQSPEETLSRADEDYQGKGDCEDFTNYFLWRMKQYGVPLERLGMCVTTNDVGRDHMVPIAKDNRGEWIYMETDEPGPGVCLYKPVEDRVFNLSSLRIYGLHEGGQVVKRERYKNDEKISFKEFQRLTEEELTEKGFAID